MNRTCDGKSFIVDEKWYWCCLMDGSFTKVESALEEGYECPTCHRPIVESTVEVDVRVKVTRQICFRHNREWHDFQYMLLPG